jgi:hypothetical protein
VGVEVLHTDLEQFLPGWYRNAFAELAEEYCQGVQFDRVEPDAASGEPFPARLVVFRDDSGPSDLLGTGERSIGVSVLAGTKEDPTEAKQIALMVHALAPRLPAVEAGNPITALRGRNGPYAVAENQPRARQYLTLTLAVAGRPL